MTVRSVHWHEGMFLWPQQMQQAERYFAGQVHLSGTWDTHYNWGLRSFELDGDALDNGRFAVRSLKARLRDGTLLSVPEDALLPVLDLKDALERKKPFTVMLAVPSLRLGKPNAAGSSSPQEDRDEARFIVGSQEYEDENIGADSQPIEVRRLNAKFLFSFQDQAG